jgi:1-phosphofructokinase family hexose kinase
MIAVICLHPAIDRTLELHTALGVGSLNRIAQVWERPGGKGVNVASVLAGLGVDVPVILPVAGFNGAKLTGLLKQQNISSIKLPVAGETRECQALLAGGSQPTEVNESGPSLEVADLVRLEGLIPAGTDLLVLSGSLAPGLTPADFGVWVKKLSSKFRVVVDSSGAALKAAIQNDAWLVKPNDGELEGLGLTALQIFQRYGTRVLHSRGAAGLEYIGEVHHSQPACEIAALNPVGAGDATLAGFLFSLERGDPIQAALRFASACGAAACLEPVAGVVDGARLKQLLEPELSYV